MLNFHNGFIRHWQQKVNRLIVFCFVCFYLKVPETDEHADTNNNNNINNNNRPQGVLELTKETFDQQTSDGLTFVDFFAPW